MVDGRKKVKTTPKKPSDGGENKEEQRLIRQLLISNNNFNNDVLYIQNYESKHWSLYLFVAFEIRKNLKLTNKSEHWRF